MTHKLYDCGGLGFDMWLDTSTNLQMKNRSVGHYETEKLTAMRDFLRPGMVFVDVGACLGYFSLYAASLVGATGKVFSIEPNPVNCAWLQIHRHINGFQNIMVMNGAIGDSRHVGTCALYLSEQSGQHSLVGPPGERVTSTFPVNVNTLDWMCPFKVDAVKIDVEGFEGEVLAGGNTVLTSKPEMLLMMDVHPGYGVVNGKLRALLDLMGYEVRRDEGNSIIALRGERLTT